MQESDRFCTRKPIAFPPRIRDEHSGIKILFLWNTPSPAIFKNWVNHPIAHCHNAWMPKISARVPAFETDHVRVKIKNVFRIDEVAKAKLEKGRRLQSARLKFFVAQNNCIESR